MGNVFKNETIQMRILELEYDFPKMTENEIITEIERIYLEESGTPFTGDIEIEQMRLTDEEIKTGEEEKQIYVTDAKASAIVISNGEDLEDQIIFVSRGSESSEDWIDNVLSIGVGSGGAAYNADTLTFLNLTKEKHGEDLPIYALGHSKANNTLTGLQMNTEPFNEVNTFNGAQSNVYQQISSDHTFTLAVVEEFNLKAASTQAIRSIPPEELEVFAKDYYEDKGTNIHQTRSKSDFLYALDAMPGMFVVGNVQEHKTDYANDGFVGVMDSISQEDLQILSNFLAPYGEIYAEEGMGGVLLVAIQDTAAFYLENPEFDPLDFQSIQQSLSGMVESLENAGYISEKDASLLNSHMRALILDIESIYTRVYEGEGMSLERLLDDGTYGFLFYNIIAGRLEKIAELFNGVGEAAYEHHSLEALMNELAVGKSYQGGEMYLELGGGPGGQGQIKLNLSKTLDAYAAITSVLDEQDAMLEKYLGIMEQEYTEYYEGKKQQLGSQIASIESNYKSYQSWLPTFYSGLITNLKFHESFKPLVGAPMEGMALAVRQNREKIETTAEEMRKAVEEVFDVEHNVAGMFKHLSG